MAAFAQLPWLPSADQFLKAMIAGGERGVQLERLRQNDRPRGGGGFGAIVRGGPSPLEAARTAAVTGEETRAAENAAAEKQAWEMNNSLISRGAPPDEAYAESGLARFGTKTPDAGVSPISLGRGGVGVFNKSTGGVEIVREPAPADEGSQPRYTGPTSVDIFGKPAGSARLTLEVWSRMGSSLPDQVRTNAPVADYIKWGNPTGAVQPAAVANQSFSNEDEARRSGATTGDVIYLAGIGKVRLK